MSKEEKNLLTVATVHTMNENKYPQGVKWNEEVYSHWRDWEHGTKLVRREDIEALIQAQPTWVWNCGPTGGQTFKEFSTNDRKENPKKRCPHCGTSKEKIEEREISYHQKLICKEELLDEVQSSQ